MGPTGGRDVVTRVEGDLGWNTPTTMVPEGSTSSHVAAAGIDEVWAVLQVVYDEVGIPLEVVNRPGRYMGNPDFAPRRIGGQRLSRFLDCGYGVTATPRADDYRVNMGVITRISTAEGGGTSVVTELVANAEARDVSAAPVQCSSKGRLETTIIEMITEKLGRET